MLGHTAFIIGLMQEGCIIVVPNDIKGEIVKCVDDADTKLNIKMVMKEIKGVDFPLWVATKHLAPPYNNDSVVCYIDC